MFYDHLHIMKEIKVLNTVHDSSLKPNAQVIKNVLGLWPIFSLLLSLLMIVIVKTVAAHVGILMCIITVSLDLLILNLSSLKPITRYLWIKY